MSTPMMTTPMTTPITDVGDDDTPRPPLISLLRELPDAHARAMAEAQLHRPLFRLSLRFSSGLEQEPLWYKEDDGRGFAEVRTLKLVPRPPPAGSRYSHAIELFLVDLGCTGELAQ